MGAEPSDNIVVIAGSLQRVISVFINNQLAFFPGFLQFSVHLAALFRYNAPIGSTLTDQNGGMILSAQ